MDTNGYKWIQLDTNGHKWIEKDKKNNRGYRLKKNGGINGGQLRL